MCESSAEYDFSSFISDALIEMDAKIKLYEETKTLYKILNNQDLKLRRDDVIREVTSVLGISDDDASRVLRKYKWDVSWVYDQWFSDMDAVKASLGLQDPGPSAASADHMRSAACRHHYCTPCWRGYVNNAIANGPASLDLRCPTPKCKACVPAELILSVAEPADADRWSTFALRSFVEDNRNMSCLRPALPLMCPRCVGQGCEAAVVECKVDRAAGEALDVSCSCCGATFCFNCHEDAHRPCKYEFCWLCLALRTSHADCKNCNRFVAGQGKRGDVDEAKRDHAKQSLDRYMHHFESCCGTDGLYILLLYLPVGCSPESPGKGAIIECRRVLSWTYTYGYYSFDPQSPTAKADANNKTFFEFLQSDAENSLERLHEAAEKQANKVLEDFKTAPDTPSPKAAQACEVCAPLLQTFRTRLTGLTDVTRRYFATLVDQLERGFNDLERDFPGGQQSISKKGPQRGDALLARQLQQKQGFWTCRVCTYHNKAPAPVGLSTPLTGSGGWPPQPPPCLQGRGWPASPLHQQGGGQATSEAPLGQPSSTARVATLAPRQGPSLGP
ncbi:hypothetical protein V8C86DRAFT_2440016 [Haematococcus lacustris]